MTPRRMKTYSGESGYVYQYYFLETQPRKRLLGRGGTAFLFHVSSDRKSFSVVEVVVEHAAVESWNKSHGRGLTDNEKYAAAKMRLFRAFDEASTPEGLRHVKVDEQNIEALLKPLRLDQ